AGSLGYYVLLALLFSTVRRKNGCAAVQDLLSRTRVIRRSLQQVRPALVSEEAVPLKTEATSKVGPYHIIEPIGRTAAGEWLLGYDTRLLRKVWIRVVAPGTPPVRPELRNLGRAGR